MRGKKHRRPNATIFTTGLIKLNQLMIREMNASYDASTALPNTPIITGPFLR
jgi:hypothetical protein